MVLYVPSAWANRQAARTRAWLCRYPWPCVLVWFVNHGRGLRPLRIWPFICGAIEGFTAVTAPSAPIYKTRANILKIDAISSIKFEIYWFYSHGLLEYYNSNKSNGFHYLSSFMGKLDKWGIRILFSADSKRGAGVLVTRNPGFTYSVCFLAS